MAAAPTRRALLTACAGLCLTRPTAAQKSGMNVEDLLEIGDDDRGMIDALTYLLWRSASMAEIVTQAGLPTVDAKYTVSYAEGGPASFDPNALPNFFFFNDRLSVALACDVVATYAGAYTGAVKTTEVSNAVNQAVANPQAVNFSNQVYRRLLLQTRTRPDSAPLLEYLKQPNAWGPQLLATVTDEHFYTSILYLAKSAPDVARRRLNLTRYKVGLFAPNAMEQIRSAWRAPELKDTVFPIAAVQPWPENFYARFRNGGPNPMKPLIDRATSLIRKDSYQKCRPPMIGSRETRKVCDDATRDVYGEPVWHVLKNRASAYGWLANPRYPDGYKD